MSIRQQCELLSFCRSGYYYQNKGENALNIQAMHLMDRYIQEEPTAGVITMRSLLADQAGIHMSYERVRRLMRKAAIMPIYPRRHLTQKGNNEYLYPYLLRNLEINRCNQVWEIDITYIPMKQGFMYMTAIIDVYSRYIVGWGLSNSMEASESLQVIKTALAIHGKPEILNSDQGVQFSCREYIQFLKEEGIRISMDGKGRCLDNIYIERFWRTIKYQYIYLHAHDNGWELYKGIKSWLDKYQHKRHQGIELQKPIELYQKVA